MGHASWVIVFCMIGAGGVSAQLIDFQTPGNLQATQNPGCISLDRAGGALAPPDLSLGVQACAKKGDYDKAVVLYIVMQLRARFDTLRVADVTAHQGEQVLATGTFDALTVKDQTDLQAAFGRFGDSGSPHHTALCAAVKRSGPPSYAPVYMIQHGMGAVTGAVGDGFVSGFKPGPAWAGLLRDYLKCANP